MGEVSYLPDAEVRNDDCYLSPLVPPGVYQLAYVRHAARRMFGRSPKLIVWFRILDFGESNGAVIPRYYNLRELSGKPNAAGNFKRFKVGQRSDLMHEFALVCVIDRTMRLDQLPIARLGEFVLKGRVRTVTHNRKQKRIHDQLQYSVVETILGKEE